MAKYDIHARRDGGAGLLLDVQADLLSELNTRLVVPLLPEDEAPRPATRLNPLLVVDGRRWVMVTQFAAAVLTRELGPTVASLRHEADAVDGAVDMLVIGF
jgi:toxin CcdB